MAENQCCIVLLVVTDFFKYWRPNNYFPSIFSNRHFNRNYTRQNLHENINTIAMEMRLRKWHSINIKVMDVYPLPV